MNTTENQPLAKIIVAILEDKQAEDITEYNVRGYHPLTDSIIIATVNNTRKMQSLVDEIRKQTAKEGLPFHHMEGQPESGWVLIDLFDVILHLFSPDMRTRVEVEPILKSLPNRKK
jgi:ribosome-associated protein